jgi:EAL domain-containing protein (putative c-di-GMP-specific phosphodiesterase class I)
VILADLGCHSFQGFLCSRPVPLDEFELLLPGFAASAAFATV